MLRLSIKSFIIVIHLMVLSYLLPYLHHYVTGPSLEDELDQEVAIMDKKATRTREGDTGRAGSNQTPLRTGDMINRTSFENSSASNSHKSRGRMNVLFIIADDLRPQLNSYKGTFNPNPFNNHPMHTPNLDALAGTSLLLDRAYVQFSVCGPSRASYMTGRRPDTTKIWDNAFFWRDIAGNFTTIPQHFKNAGYRTLSVGKIYHPGRCGGYNDPLSWSERQVPTKSYDIYNSKSWWDVPENTRKEMPLEDDQITEIAIDILTNHTKDADTDQPLFLAVGFRKPHVPFVAPAKYFEYYPLEKMTLAKNQYFPVNAPEIEWFHIEVDAYNDMKMYNLSRDISQILPETPAKLIRRAYFACVSYIDDMIGKLIKTVKDLGLAENTIISFIGDHGYHLGENGMWGKHTDFEQALHAPLMLHIPGQTDGGVESDSLVEFVDLFPTLAEAAGLTPVPPCPAESSKVELCTEGVSFLDLVQHPERPVKNKAISQSSKDKLMGYTLRTDKHRYTEWTSRNTTYFGHNSYRHDILWDTVAANGRELYDHEVDPEENVNIADDPEQAPLVQRLSTELRQAVRDTIVFNHG